MKSSEVIQAFKSAINATKEAGIKVISIDDLEEYSSRLEEDVLKTPEGASAGEAAMEAYKADLNSWLSSRQQAHENSLEMLRATITTGQMALKSSLLINGGASVAMLAFIGNLWSKEQALSCLLEQLGLSLAFFVFGVLSAAVASGFTYFSQAGYAGEFGKFSNKFGVLAHIVTVMCVLTAYVLFANGAYLAYASIING
jgi:hypothetical protein